MEIKSEKNENFALRLVDLHKTFGDKEIHKGVSLDLRDGEIMGLFGGSGQGKSVILRSIIGLEQPDSGQILFEDKDLMTLSEFQLFEIRTHISYVFQNGALFDSLTVEENLAYPLQAHTKLSAEEIHQKVVSVLEMIDMSSSIDLLPNELSGGMQKRAGFARSIMLDPKIVLFDEPTAGLDPVNTGRLLKNILAFKERGMTGIFVTHDIPAAFAICDRVAILSEGKIAMVLTVEEMKRSEDPLVKSFTTGAHIDETQ